VGRAADIAKTLRRWVRRSREAVWVRSAFAGFACMPLPSSDAKKFTHLTERERGIIRIMYRHSSLAFVARTIQKDPSTVSREIRRNRNIDGVYYEVHADSRAKRRRLAAKAGARIIENDLQLQGYIERLFTFGLSPEQIAGYMRRQNHERPLSYRTLYRWTHRDWQARKKYLRYRGKPRVPYGRKKDSWDPHKRHISERPRIVEKRERVGDWEADLVHGTQDDSRHCILTLNDRATGFCIARKVVALDSTSMAYVMIDALRHVPVQTITCDNGSEFGRHRLVEQKLKCKVYFTDPNSPQQRGSNENLNGLIREYFPKRKSLINVTQVQITEVVTRLNGRPRKRYGYEAPRRLFAQKTGLSPYFVR
jgi:transposase, IS30 family